VLIRTRRGSADRGYPATPALAAAPPPRSGFPAGELSWFGDNIEITEAGRYRITADFDQERFELRRLDE
jgi:hypothetical protein